MLAKRGLDRKPGIAVFEQGSARGQLFPSIPAPPSRASKSLPDRRGYRGRRSPGTRFHQDRSPPVRSRQTHSQEMARALDVLISCMYSSTSRSGSRDEGTGHHDEARSRGVCDRPASVKGRWRTPTTSIDSPATFRQMPEASGLVVEEMHSVDRLCGALSARSSSGAQGRPLLHLAGASVLQRRLQPRPVVRPRRHRQHPRRPGSRLANALPGAENPETKDESWPT